MVMEIRRLLALALPERQLGYMACYKRERTSPSLLAGATARGCAVDMDFFAFLAPAVAARRILFTPTTVAPSGTAFVTTAPAPTVTPSPI
jgi:hypothetical protein